VLQGIEVVSVQVDARGPSKKGIPDEST